MAINCPVCNSEGYDTVYDSPVASLRFANNFRTPILNGEKTLTVRREVPGEIATGNIVAFVNEDDNEFAWAKIVSRARMRCEDVVRTNWEGHRTYDSIEEFALSMRVFHPDEYFGPDSYVTVIWYEVVMEVDHEHGEREVLK